MVRDLAGTICLGAACFPCGLARLLPAHKQTPAAAGLPSSSLPPAQPATPRPSATARPRWCWPLPTRCGSTTCRWWAGSWALATQPPTPGTSPRRPRWRCRARWAQQVGPGPDGQLLLRFLFWSCDPALPLCLASPQCAGICLGEHAARLRCPLAALASALAGGGMGLRGLRSCSASSSFLLRSLLCSVCPCDPSMRHRKCSVPPAYAPRRISPAPCVQAWPAGTLTTGR